ncbi:MAG TPA: hypothetical protein VGB92_04980 [Longimicrobium sp.]
MPGPSSVIAITAVCAGRRTPSTPSSGLGIPTGAGYILRSPQ